MTVGRAISIDLGTSYCRIAVCNDNHVEIIPNDQGNLTTPSYVAFTDTQCLIGDAAKTQAVLNPHNTIFDIKRLIGLTRAQFEEICQDLFCSVCDPIEKALHDAHIDKAQVDRVVLVGGSTRIPKIVQLVSDFFDGKQPTRVPHLDQDMVAAHGVAFQAAVLTGSYSTRLREFLLFDVTPFPLGIDTAGGIMAPLVRRNALVPTRAIQTVTTTFYNQPGVLVEVYKGSRAHAKDNTFLAHLVLPGIPPAPRRVPRLEVTFAIDANQHLVVSVTDTATGRSNSVAVPGRRRGLTDSEMVDLVVEANVAAARAAARARFTNYVDDLRDVLDELEQKYNERRKRLEAVLRPLTEKFAATAALNPLDVVDIPEMDVVDEETLRKWTVAVAGPDEVPSAAPGPVDDDMDSAAD
ncbi:transporter [Ganoderma sinense ZZ0214-1]|uniref:Transporter n=1 Tax=Ganoderma sinense ZZ0214-1 TaxID=1077348 RepID=A0A2G8S3E7_9APHY|nr:transporter [Ganoderma sinense ZZ0214-1]